MIKPILLSLMTLTLAAAEPIPASAWQPVSDQQLLLGSSFVSVGDTGSDTAIRLSGSVQRSGRDPFKEVDPFAGAIHYLGATPNRSVDLSAARTLSFKVKGHGQLAVSLFQKGTGVQPYTQTVTVGADWQQVTLDLASFKADPHQLTAVAFGRNTPGTLDVVVDDIRIQ
nr:hypothetical protein [uncultured Holophaga sp.]